MGSVQCLEQFIHVVGGGGGGGGGVEVLVLTACPNHNMKQYQTFLPQSVILGRIY